MSRARTGIETVDEWLGGGFPRPSSSLLLSNSPTEKRELAEQFVVSGMVDGEVCVYVDFFRSPSLARSQFRNHGVTEQSRLIIVDAVSNQIMVPSEEKYVIRDVLDMNQIQSVIREALENERPGRVVIDSLEFLLDRFPKESVIDFWHFLREASEDTGTASLVLFMNWTLEDRELNRMRQSADCVLEFETRTAGHELQNLVKVHEKRELGISESDWVPFAIREPVGGPAQPTRILVIGSKDSGKNDFVSSLCSRTVVDETGHVGKGRDRRRLDVSDIDIEVLGDPADESFAAMFRLFSREVSGVFLVVDSTNPQDIERGRAIVASSHRNVRLAVIVTKREVDGAIPVDEIETRMELPEDVSVIEAPGTEEMDAPMALERLFRRQEAKIS